MEDEHNFCSPSIVETPYIKEIKTEEFLPGEMDDNKTSYRNK
jgi:hypothetical protein